MNDRLTCPPIFLSLNQNKPQREENVDFDDSLLNEPVLAAQIKPRTILKFLEENVSLC